MDFSIKTADRKNPLSSVAAGSAVLALFEESLGDGAEKALDAGGIITQIRANGDFTGKTGTSLLISAPAGISAKRLVLAGLGKAPGSIAALRQASGAALSLLSNLPAGDVLFILPDAAAKGRMLPEAIYAVVTECYTRLYRSDALKNRKEEAEKIKSLSFYLPASRKNAGEKALKEAVAINEGRVLAKNLGNLPGNICTPAYLAEEAKKLAEKYGFTADILDRRQIAALKMNSFLSVAKGSDVPPKFIVLKHMQGPREAAPAVLVGKGITFDAGGISLKPGAGMDEMKFDMCGAASVLGTFMAIGELGLKQNVIGIIPSCENLPSGAANKPGDIITTMSGQTVEILNTDAEGRLILCDALTYAERFKPAAVVDIATLTGACVVALGHIMSGLFTRDDAAHNRLADELLAAAKKSNDPVWRMPVDDAYQDMLKSNFADMANIGGRPAGCVTAACFLERFAKKYTWAHLDIAGTAWKSGSAKGATGRPVPLLVSWLISREEK